LTFKITLNHYYFGKCIRVQQFADHGGRAVWGVNRLRPIKHWGCRFEFHSRHGCLCAFILCLCCSVCRQRPCDWLITRSRSPTDCV
jgi:hypothetical protein